MRCARLFLLSAGLALTATCGSDVLEPGALTITLSAPPPGVTNAATVQVTGQVTRTPAATAAVLVVTVTGGPSAVTDTAAADGSFALTVGLALNTTNQFQVSASDPSGSTGAPATFSVRHDNLPPTVASSTPANQADQVTSATLAVVFSEAIRPGTATIAVTQQSVAVGGATSLSADSLTLTFTPTVALAPNAIHDVVIGGAQDAAGNATAGASRCFVTGGAAVASVTDPEDDAFVTEPPPNPTLVPMDLVEMRFARTIDVFYLIARFDAARSLSLAAPNNVTAVIDFDMDQDGSTGVVPFKDVVLGAVVGDSSGAGAEYLIELGDWIGTDSAFVGQYTSQGNVTGAQFNASACGTLVGWAVPLTFLGGADDAFDAVAYFDSFDAAGAYADGAPNTGVYSIALTQSAGAASALVTTALPINVLERRSRRFPRRPR